MTTAVRENAQGIGGSRQQNAGPNALVMILEGTKEPRKDKL